MGWALTTVVLLSTLILAPTAWCQGGGTGNGKPQKARKPHPARIEPLATQSLLLGIVDTGSRLVAVGAHGHILVSKGGKKWRQVHSPARATLTAVAFADAEHGWAVGWDSVILHTSDGGKTWRLQNFRPGLKKPLFDVLALSRKHALAVGAFGLVMETRDGGKHWTQVSKRFNPRDSWHLNSLTRLRDGKLLIAGEKGTLGLSSDGGKTWKTLSSPYPGPWFDAVAMGQHGALLAGLVGHVYCTPAPGKGWHRLDVGTSATLMSATRLTNGRILLTGQGGTIRMLPGQACSKHIQVTTPENKAFDYLAGGAVGANGDLIVIGVDGIRTTGAYAGNHRR